MTRLDRTNAVHHVYRCFDGAGRLIYVGSSANLFGRLAQHRQASWWSSQVERVTAKVYPTGTIARQHERRAIVTEQPRWNKSGRWVTRHEWTRDQWDDWLTMLIHRDSFGPEMRKFVGLYEKKWGAAPPGELMVAVVAAEERHELRVAETNRRLAEMRERQEEVRREDELGLRRERKAARAKARRLAKKAKRAKQIAEEYDLAIASVIES